MGGVLEAYPDAERLVATQVGEECAVLFVRVVAECGAEPAAQQGQAPKELMGVEGLHFRIAVVNHSDFITQGLIEGLFKAHVGIDFKVVPRTQAHAGRPLARVETTVVAQVKAAVERAGGRRLHQPLRHAAAWCGAQLEVEVSQFALENLCVGKRTPEQAAEQEKGGLEHASLHDRGSRNENLMKCLI
ncbi:hypothetical protein D3C73_1161850 [compost metagenome]